jgi:hypothetical protein
LTVASIISIIFSGNTGKIMAAQRSIMKGRFPEGIPAPPPARFGRLLPDVVTTAPTDSVDPLLPVVDVCLGASHAQLTCQARETTGMCQLSLRPAPRFSSLMRLATE